MLHGCRTPSTRRRPSALTCGRSVSYATVVRTRLQVAGEGDVCGEHILTTHTGSLPRPA
jgi:hypothetical protein